MKKKGIKRKVKMKKRKENENIRRKIIQTQNELYVYIV